MAGARGLALKRPSAIPGFGLALGFTLTYLSLIVLIPLAALVLKAATLGFSGFWDVVTGAAYSRGAAAQLLHVPLCRGAVNAVFGVIIAWVLVRYRFPGQASVRRLRRSSLRASHRRRRHRPDCPLCAEWLAR